jgi:SSS family solute:Na+ symporter
MSGMAGNVTAFNTVWTYDIYKPYLKSDGDDAHYIKVGRQATVFGTILSVATAYVAMNFGNINDLLQLVFSFINAPLFATFLLGMFWARSTANGAFLTGVGAGGTAGLHVYPSDMARNFWGAIYSWTTCFAVTIGVSLVTKPRAAADLKGLVYSMTPRIREEGLAWYKRPVVLAVIVGAVTLAINIYFW